MNMNISTTLAAAALTVAGCANVTAVTVSDENPAPNGIRVNGVASILIADGGGARVAQIANPCVQYAVQIDSFLAKNKTKLDFNDNGSAKTVDTDLDSTDALEAIKKGLEIAEGLVNAVSEDAASRAAEQSETQVYAFECVKGRIVASSVTEKVKLVRKLASVIVNADNETVVEDDSKTSLAPGG